MEFLAIATLLLVIPPWSDAQLTAEIPYLESTIGITYSDFDDTVISIESDIDDDEEGVSDEEEDSSGD